MVQVKNPYMRLVAFVVKQAVEDVRYERENKLKSQGFDVQKRIKGASYHARTAGHFLKKLSPQFIADCLRQKNIRKPKAKIAYSKGTVFNGF